MKAGAVYEKEFVWTRISSILVVIGIFYIIGAISEASESKCIKSGCDNKQARNSSYCYLHKPYTGSSSSHSSSSYSNKSSGSRQQFFK